MAKPRQNLFLLISGLSMTEASKLLRQYVKQLRRLPCKHTSTKVGITDANKILFVRRKGRRPGRHYVEI